MAWQHRIGQPRAGTGVRHETPGHGVHQRSDGPHECWSSMSRHRLPWRATGPSSTMSATVEPGRLAGTGSAQSCRRTDMTWPPKTCHGAYSMPDSPCADKSKAPPQWALAVEHPKTTKMFVHLIRGCRRRSPLMTSPPSTARFLLAPVDPSGNPIEAKRLVSGREAADPWGLVRLRSPPTRHQPPGPER